MHSEVPFNTEVTKRDCGDVPFHLGGGGPSIIFGLNLRIIKPKLNAGPPPPAPKRTSPPYLKK